MSSQSLAVIRLEGELEISRRDEIARALQLDGSERGILLDFSDVTYADSTTLAELLRFRADAERLGVPVAILIASKQFARLIQYAGLSAAFEIFGERSAALTYLANPEQA
ncbi:MAG: STAS domain-containing protein [Candidatus Eremiobacteraeota bacterium]|nr:STAS domain-containing protein [Candidatus Eremiobacteraeota bacterium]